MNYKCKFDFTHVRKKKFLRREKQITYTKGEFISETQFLSLTELEKTYCVPDTLENRIIEEDKAEND